MPNKPAAQKNKGGRPSKRDSKAIEMSIVRLLKNGNTRTTAAIASGISPRTLQRWCRRSVRFCRVIDQAEAEAVSLYVNALTTNAVSGDTKAIIFYLTHRHGDDWKPPKETKVLEGTVGVKMFTDAIMDEV